MIDKCRELIQIIENTQIFYATRNKAKKDLKKILAEMQLDEKSKILNIPKTQGIREVICKSYAESHTEIGNKKLIKSNINDTLANSMHCFEVYIQMYEKQRNNH